jgi:hypothetical protein
VDSSTPRTAGEAALAIMPKGNVRHTGNVHSKSAMGSAGHWDDWEVKYAYPHISFSNPSSSGTFRFLPLEGFLSCSTFKLFINTDSEIIQARYGS